MTGNEKWLAIPGRPGSLEPLAFEQSLGCSRTAVGMEATVKLLHDLVRLVDERNAKMAEQRAFQDWPRVDLLSTSEAAS